uniref:Zn(2)-C6 fungal-type domain-containing protein n=1 Tax=Melanopsichium pennsylvanicum 4 TaxID=1398559 RepID=A0A077R381_9BASI|nr:conserved hypothetical protein [Melanopsichium pennsylvanicum 4]
MAQKTEAVRAASSPSVPRTRKPGEVRSRNGCMTCKQRRKKCDEDFYIRHNGAMSCNRCADRGIHCEMSSVVTPQRASQQQQRPSPYPTPNASPSSSAKLASRSVRGLSATPAAHHADLPSAATSTGPNASSGNPTGSLDMGTTGHTPALDPNQLWTASAHFPMQQFSQQQKLQNVATFPGLQNPAVMNQLAWMSQNAAALNRSAVRYNRPNIWPMGSSNGIIDSVNTNGIQIPAGTAPAQNNAVDMNTLFNLMNSNPVAPLAAPNTTQWNQGYTSSMDNIMLDDFVSELMSLTGPLVGGESASSAPPTTSDNTPSTGAQQSSPLEKRPASRLAHDSSHASTSTSTSSSQRSNPAETSASSQSRQANFTENSFPSSSAPKPSNGKAANRGRTSNRYRRLLDSDAIESLLSKYSPIYERFWHATLMLLSNKKRQTAVDYLMSIVRSNKACRASVVVVCLAYHELVQRVRKGAQKDNIKQTQPPPQNWTSVATKAVHDSKSTAKIPEDGMSHTVLNMFPRDGEDDERHFSRSAAAEDANSEVMRHASRSDNEDEEIESEEEISKIRGRTGDRSFSSTSIKLNSDRYGSTSFSRRTESTSKSPLLPSRNLTGKLSTVEDNIQQMDDPSRDAFKGQKVEEYTVELWFNIAQAELQRSREELTLDQELCAIINLRWACLCFAGAERARQLTEELGKVMQREGIDMDHASEEEKKGSFVSVMLLTAVYTDVLDTVSDRGKRTHVSLRDGNQCPTNELSKLRCVSSSVLNGEATSMNKDEPFFGRISLISLEMLTCFKLISDLAADIWGPIRGNVSNPSRPSEEQVIERSREIERKVMCLPPWSDPNTSSSLRVRAFTLQEIWRQTARLYLLQAVHRRGPLHSELQNILHEIIRLAKMMKIQSFSPNAPIYTSNKNDYSNSNSSGNGRAGQMAFRSAPANYIGGLSSALTREDRAFCIHHLESLGLERANRDNIQVIRDYWAKQDTTGHTLDWFDFIKSSGRSVIFAF